ncbi:hypothetical protein [Streptomyces sp. 1222.5]|uniref:hypothetical protein n=1 Tax=Streptomyces sp. 1222.5 TaxID=1881026 RepID=UPI003EB6BA55
MTAVAVEIAPYSPRRPLPGDNPDQSGQPYFTRPVLAAVEPVIADMDRVMDSAKCSCAAGDDNPH